VGILLARTVSGFVAATGSWRTVFWVAAALTLLLVVVLSRALPVTQPKPGVSYGGLLRTTVELFLAEPLLRRRCGLGALGMATFSVFWTSIAFLLAGAPYHYSDEVIGLFGLVGAAGALCATYAGRLADQGRSGLATTVFCVLIAVSFGPIAAGSTSVGWLIVGIVLLDIGVQGLQVTNQSIIYSVAPDARSRVNSAYMVCYFTGGAIGSALAGTIFGDGGWAGICWLGAGLGVAASLLSLVALRRPLVASHAA
jgi:predicted MFS family arabinose efflux permease